MVDPLEKWKENSQWEKYINHISNKRLVSRLYKELLELNAKDFGGHFSEEDMQIAYKHMKYWSKPQWDTTLFTLSIDHN